MLKVSAFMSDTWKSGMFQAITTPVSSTVVQSEKCSPFSLFFNSFVKYGAPFFLDRYSVKEGQEKL